MSQSLAMCVSSLCCTLVACSMLRILLPEGNVSRLLAGIVGVFMLVCMIAPVTSFFESFSADMIETKGINTEKLNEEYDKTVLRKAAEYINIYCEEILKSEGVSFQKLETNLGVSEDKGIYVRSVCIYTNKSEAENARNIIETIERAVAVKPQVICN